MARIPTGDFGNLTPRVVPAPDVGRAPTAGARALGAVGESLTSAGGVVQSQIIDEAQKAHAERKRVAAEQKQHDDEVARSRAMMADDLIKVDADTLLADVQQKLASGQMKREDVSAHVEGELSKITANRLKDVRPDFAEIMQPRVDAVRGRFQIAVGKVIDGNRRDELLSNFETMRDAMAKQAGMPGANVAQIGADFEAKARVLGKEAGLPDDKLGKVIQDFKDRSTFSGYESALLTARNSMGALADLEKRLSKEGNLDPERRIQISNQILGYRSHLQQQAEIAAARAARAQEARLRNAEATMNGIAALTQAGKFVAPEEVQRAAAAVKGTPYEKMLPKWLEQAPKAVSFAAQPLPQQQAALDAMAARGNTPGKGWTTAEQKQYDDMRKVAAETQRAVDKDPMRAALERGVIQELPPVNPLDPNSLRARASAAGVVSAWVGKSVSPFTADEAGAAGELLAGLAPKQRVEAMKMIATQMDAGQSRAFASQLGAKGTTMATAFAAAASGRTSTQNRPLAELILLGEDALKQGTAKIDAAKETGIKAQIYKQINGAYATPAITESVADAAMKVYAARKAEGDDNVERAVRLVTGGIYKQASGAPIVKPYGWSDEDFLAKAQKALPEQFRAMKFGRDVTLSPSPYEGKYGLDVGGRPAFNPDGSRVLIDLGVR